MGTKVVQKPKLCIPRHIEVKEDYMNRTQNLFTAGGKITVNKDGFPAFKRSLPEQYLQTLMTNTMGNTFYTKQDQLMVESLALHREIAKVDPEFMAKALVYARNDGYMRLQPIVGLVFLSTIPDKTFFKLAFNQVIKTPGDLEDFVTICSSVRNGKGLGRSVKNTISLWLNNMSQYHAIKYGADRKEGWDLGNIIKVTHPKPKDEIQNELFKYVANRDADLGKLPQVNELERVKNLRSMKATMTDEAFAKEVVDAIERGRLPWEVVTGILSPTTEVWEYLMKQMPYFALLRNINTLTRAGVFSNKENVDYVVRRLTDANAIHKAMVLPFRFHTALANTGSIPAINDALRTAMELSFDNVPALHGNNYYFLDISGSMDGENLTIGGTLGIAAYMKSEQPNFLCFESRLQYADITKNDSMMTNLQKVLKLEQGGTNTGLCLKHLLGTAHLVKEFGWARNMTSGYHNNVPENMRTQLPVEGVDNIIIITDEQQNTGSPVVTEFRKYRELVNPNARLFIIDVAPYLESVAPDEESNCYFIYGWSDQVLKYLSFVIDGMGTQLDAVNAIELK